MGAACRCQADCSVRAASKRLRKMLERQPVGVQVQKVREGSVKVCPLGFLQAGAAAAAATACASH